MSREIGITVKKGADFSEWYTQVVLKAELADYAPMKGFIILRPYGYALWEKITGYLDKRFKQTGHRNAYFPALIPEGLLAKEAEHFKGFTPEVFWVKRAGDQEISEMLALRPTSETIAYEAFARWVRSWRDLPLLLNFWNSVMRAEIKATKPFLRTSEFLWQEGHTVHATKEEADEEVLRMLRIYKELVETQLAIPVLEGRKSEKEKFVGALYTTTLEAMMPDGKALQMGTSHNLGQNFSKAFGIKYLGKDKEEHYAWQTSWGVSWRLIGALIMVHGDDRGLVLPPGVAPMQVVIVPIYYSDDDRANVMRTIARVGGRLRRARVKVLVDDREGYTPGWKFNEWELKGVPLRVEVGPRDVKGGVITLVRRDTSEKIVVAEQDALKMVKELMKGMQESLFAKASNLLSQHTHEAGTYDELKALVDSVGGFVKAPWCSQRECEESIKEETGADVRLVPFDTEAGDRRCVKCGGRASVLAYFGRAY